VKPRDDFPDAVKLLLAKRAGFRCSNPNCRHPTAGPTEDPSKASNIGVAAHITAATAGGPRFNPALSQDERRAPENGIWLCQNHGKLVDDDQDRYTVELLGEWKRLAEEAARLELESPASPQNVYDDVELVRFFSQCLDRPALQDPFRQEGSVEAFDRAISDTITALSTGCLRSRDGAVLAQARGKSFLRNDRWRDRMDAITDMLRAIRSRYGIAKRLGQIHVHQRLDGDEVYTIHDPSVADWMDHTRDEIVRLFGEICREAGLRELHFPGKYWSRLPRW
jgi:hypothetical protein